MRIYIAAPYPLRAGAIKAMQYLEARGHEVTSRWLKAPDEMTDAYAREDLADIFRADMLLAINPQDWAERGTGGRHVETGYALALDKKIVILGARTNIFHHLSHVRIIENLEELG